MAKKVKSSRLKAKTMTKAKTKTTSTKKPKSKSKPEKKTKMETTKLHLSKPLKIADNFDSNKLGQPTPQMHGAEATKKPEQVKATVLPINNYRLEVDGRLKLEYPTAEAARKAGLDLKKKYPHIRVAVFNNKERTRTVVELSEQIS